MSQAFVNYEDNSLQPVDLGYSAATLFPMVPELSSAAGPPTWSGTPAPFFPSTEYHPFTPFQNDPLSVPLRLTPDSSLLESGDVSISSGIPISNMTSYASPVDASPEWSQEGRPTVSDWRWVEEISQRLYTKGIKRHTSPPRVSYGTLGLSLDDALVEDVKDMSGGEEDVAFPEECMGQKQSIRLEFENHGSYGHQVNVLSERRGLKKQPTKSRLAMIVAKEIKRFMNKNPNFAACYKWEQLVLLHIDIVSKGSLQPRIGVKT
ncbi:hypothetical protein C8Q74DRAFT_1374317 [Fomes fomentarius]|nr:hypothetical protein C8Q74DRAFT_1374317 [Fomes fomentarius]